MDDSTRTYESGIDSPGKSGGVEVFRLAGPGWRPRLHPGSKAIGVPDLYAGRVNQAEDDLSESSVKNGYSVPQLVGNETFSAHDMIFDRLKAKTLLSQLGDLFHEVTLRRSEISNHRSTAGPMQFRPPQRVTLNEVKLAAYVKELADPDVPLRKLARSVPHGYRGERMLDMLWNGGNLTLAMAAIKAQAVQGVGNVNSQPRSVTIERAIWFVRVVGSSEVVSRVESVCGA
jgi:mediator of RNA polymerase II transcription subunit 12